MSIRRILAAALLVPLAFVSGTLAERAPEERSDATHVVVGTVESVYMRKADGTFHYLVEVGVEKVEKGGGVKAGAVICIRCYQHDPDWLKGKVLTEKEQKAFSFRGSSYESVPKKGQRLRLYAKQRGNKYVAIFPRLV